MKWFKVSINEITSEEFLDFYNLMTDKRKEDIKSLTKDSDKKLSIAGEMLAKKGLAELSGINADKIIIEKTPSGKPETSLGGYHISISHSGDYAVCAIDISPIGIDIEKIREVNIKTSKRFCNNEEIDFIYSSKNGAFHRFFEIWTAKEAEFKRCSDNSKSFKDINTAEIIKEYKSFEDYIVCISKGAEV